nr:phenylacetate--CoA ligase [uncultured Dethiosulfovibrio sp.]
MTGAKPEFSGLKNALKRVWEVKGVYYRRMAEMGISPDDVNSMEDFQFLPLTTKEDIRDSYPTGMMACDQAKVVRFHASSGTTGKPTVVPYSAKDLDIWTQCMAQCLRTAGVTEKDVFQVILGYGLFTGALGFHYGAEAVGAAVVPTGGGFTDRQLTLMEDLGTTVFTSTPSYALHLCEEIEARGIRDRLKLRLAILGGEAWTEAMRDEIESRLGVVALNSYGLSEILGPGVAMECPDKVGMHFNDGHFFVEILDEAGRPLPVGEEGEIVITSFTKEAFPLIRYRTRDLGRLVEARCSCGRSGLMLDRVKGRNDDMLIIRGVNVFPSQIEAALGQVPGLTLNYIIEVEEKGHLKDMTVLCESRDFLDPAQGKELFNRSSSRLKEILGIRVNFRLLEPGTLDRSTGKAVRLRKVS